VLHTRRTNLPIEKGGKKVKVFLDVEGRGKQHRAPLPDDVKAERHPYVPSEGSSGRGGAADDDTELRRVEEAMEHVTIHRHIKRGNKKPADIGYEEPFRHMRTDQEIQFLMDQKENQPNHPQV